MPAKISSTKGALRAVGAGLLQESPTTSCLSETMLSVSLKFISIGLGKDCSSVFSNGKGRSEWRASRACGKPLIDRPHCLSHPMKHHPALGRLPVLLEGMRLEAHATKVLTFHALPIGNTLVAHGRTAMLLSVQGPLDTYHRASYAASRSPRSTG